MKNFAVATSILVAAAHAAPAPTDYKVDYDKVDYSNVDYSNVDWDKVDYSNVDYSKVDFDNVKYPSGATPQPPKDYPSLDGYQPVRPCALSFNSMATDKRTGLFEVYLDLSCDRHP